MKQGNHSKAFTVLETIVTITIAAAVILLSVPCLSTYAKTNKLKTETQRIARLVENLSSKAHYNNQDVLLIFLTDEYRAKYAVSGKAITTRSIPKGLTITPLNRTQLTFYRTNTATPASIKVTNSEGSCLIQISLRSRVTIGCGV